MFLHYVGSVHFPIDKLNVVCETTGLWMKDRNLVVIHSYRVSKHGALIDRGRVEKIARSVMNGITE